MASEVYKIVNDIAPDYIKDLINIKKSTYNFRRENQASLPAVKSTRYFSNEENNLLYEYQSGFRDSYSTDTCLIHVLDYIKGNTAKGLYTGMIMLDLQKAFDTVDHSILCKKIRGQGGCLNRLVQIIFS